MTGSRARARDTLLGGSGDDPVLGSKGVGTILYDPSSSALSCDDDGTGNDTAVIFAQVKAGLVPGAGDFLIV